MNRINVHWWLSFWLALSGNASASTVTCNDLDRAGLKSLLDRQGQTHVIFFATWCSSCVQHLTAKKPPGTVIIAVFSEKDAADAVVQKLSPEAPCYLDHGIAAYYHVQAVPAVIDLDRSGAAMSLITQSNTR